MTLEITARAPHECGCKRRLQLYRAILLTPLPNMLYCAGVQALSVIQKQMVGNPKPRFVHVAEIRDVSTRYNYTYQLGRVAEAQDVGEARLRQAFQKHSKIVPIA